MKTWGLIAGPLLGTVIGLIAWWGQLTPTASWTAAITVWCAVWWVTESVSIPATALLPLVAFPLTGVLNHKQVASAYGHTLIMLFLGGFILSAAMEKSGTHRRLAIGILRCTGATSGRRLVLGVMLASALLSMWISNTATVLMLLPITAAILEKINDEKMTIALVLGVAYASSIGGLGTPIGSPPNLVFMGVYQETVGKALSFLDWMHVGLPVVVILLPVAWLVLTRRIRTGSRFDLPKMGPWQPAEIRTLIVFGLTALGWVTRTAPYGGWQAWFGVPGAGDSTVALLAAVVLFVIPDGRNDRLMNWDTARKIPWNILLLFGGGLAIAKAFGASGLDQTLGGWLADITTWPVVGMTIVLCLAVSFLTEVTSNTATATMLMPILAAAGMAAKIDPARLMLPAAFSASCAFMLPIATPPNAIVFGTGRVTTRCMAREGFALNLLGAAAITLVCVVVVNR